MILTSEYISEAGTWHGGLSNYLSRICTGLVGRGHEVQLLTFSAISGIEESGGVKIHKISGNEILLSLVNKITWGLLRDTVQILFIAAAFRTYIKQNFTKGDFDIIHCSSCQAPGLFVDQRKFNVPMVTRLSSITKLAQKAAGRRNFLDMRLMNLMEKVSAKRSDRVFAPSLATVKNAKKEFGLDIDLLEPPGYIGFGDPGRWDDSVYNRYFSGKKYLLFYGTLSRLKGAEFIAKVLPRFFKKHKDHYFAIIGKVAPLDRHKSSLEPILDDAAEWHDRIIYTNSLRHPQLMPIIKKARAVLIPSRIDNLPNTLIEAMGLGKVVIGSRDAGMDQLIRDGYNGFLIDYGDEAGLLKLMDQAVGGNEGRMEEIGAQARASIGERLDFEARIIDLEKYYLHTIKANVQAKQDKKQ